jgi:HD-GYP domain-containing protein (c-di-GMP phosphodiesterase class II)
MCLRPIFINSLLSVVPHDIGKIGMSGDISLTKKKHLTFDEFNAIIMHPGYGAEMLSHIRRLRATAPSVKWRQEKRGASGYPGGLKGEPSNEDQGTWLFRSGISGAQSSGLSPG